MTKRPTNPWRVEQVEPSLVARLAAKHEPNPEAVAQGVDLVGDPHREDDDGHNWVFLSDARNVADVTPGSAVVMGSSIGRYLGKVLAWDFEVDDHDPMIVLELVPLTPQAVDDAISGSRTPAAS